MSGHWGISFHTIDQMADQEISKHLKNAIDVAAKTELSIWHRVKDIALEIAIIVFAVSLSIWLHGLSEHAHEQKQVRQFMAWVLQDMHTNLDTNSTRYKQYASVNDAYTFLLTLTPDSNFDEQKVTNALQTISTEMVPVVFQRSRYESFKSSGKLLNIEKGEALEAIVNSFEKGQFAIEYGARIMIDNQRRLNEYLATNSESDSVRAKVKLLTSSKGQYLLKQAALSPMSDMQSIITHDRAAIKAIETAYPDLH